jgi:NAD+ diphosphatase
MKKSFVPSAIPPPNKRSPAYWFAFRSNEMLVYSHNANTHVPFVENFDRLQIPVIRQQFVGFLNGVPCYSVELKGDVEPPAGMAFRNLRSIYSQINEDLFIVAGRAIQIVHWDRTHQFCGQCGAPLENSWQSHSKVCPECGLVSFPRISPAVIVLVYRGSQLLLARSPRFREKMYSVLAGFVEPGETLEEAIEREVFEETAIRLKNIRYFGSQPWPFPHSLMIGFTAEYAGGEISIDGEEIIDAGWYSTDALPLLPGGLSVARKLIDWFIAQQRG